MDSSARLRFDATLGALYIGLSVHISLHQPHLYLLPSAFIVVACKVKYVSQRELCTPNTDLMTDDTPECAESGSWPQSSCTFTIDDHFLTPRS